MTTVTPKQTRARRLTVQCARSTVEFLRHETPDFTGLVATEHSRPQPGRLQDLGLPAGVRVQDTNRPTRLGRAEAAPAAW